MNIYIWLPVSGFTSITVVFFKSKSNFSNIRMPCECICKVLDALKVSGTLDASESLLLLFSVIYHSKISMRVFLNVKPCPYFGGGEGQVCLGTLPRYGSLMIYKCPNAILLNSTFGHSHLFSLLGKLS